MKAEFEFAQINSFSHRLVTGIIGLLLNIICDIDDAMLEKVPASGPLILVTNHVNFLDAPVIYTHMMPRRITALVKEETWANPILGYLFSLWGGIAIRRGEMDLKAFRKAKQALVLGYILIIAPEGTRSGNGVLQKGYSGTSVLAAHTQAPMIPLALIGCEAFWHNIRRLKRTKITIKVGEPFNIRSATRQPDRGLREQITNDIMCRIAALLPESQRGPYRSCPSQSISMAGGLILAKQGRIE